MDPRDKKMKHSGFKNKNVIITVYVESPTVSLRDAGNLYLRHQLHPPAPKQGCNRRAELLAYSKQLRCKGLQDSEASKRKRATKGKVQRKQTVSNSKGCAWFPSRMLTTKRQWRYEKIEPQEEAFLHNHKQPKGSNWKAHVSSTLKELSSSFKCNKVDDCNRYVIKKTIRRGPRM